MAKYIFVTGGVTSSLGKGIIAASLAKLLQARGLRVTIQKFDPYINVDPGTMNPYEHGECFVTEDGAEAFSPVRPIMLPPVVSIKLLSIKSGREIFLAKLFRLYHI